MIWTCEQIEARLSDYLDDAMTRNDRASFEAHLGDCERCAPLVAHLSKLLTSMHVMEQIEPPPRLIYAILDQTLGKREPVTGWRAIFGWFEGITTMRLAYGALSVAGTFAILLTTLGFSFSKPKLADLRPARMASSPRAKSSPARPTARSRRRRASRIAPTPFRTRLKFSPTSCLFG